MKRLLESSLVLLMLAAIPLSALTVENPRADVAWCKGQSYVINWVPTVTPDGPYTVTLIQDARKVMTIASDLPVTQWNYTWRVPETLADGWYTIRVSMTGSTVSGVSGRFKIISCGTKPPRDPGHLEGIVPLDPQYDVEVSDLYFSKEGKLWIKYANLSKRAIEVTVWEEVWVGDSKIYEGRILLNMNLGGFRAHEISYTCVSTPPATRSLQVKGVIDARHEFTEVNETNNILIKTLTCPSRLLK